MGANESYYRPNPNKYNYGDNYRRPYQKREYLSAQNDALANKGYELQWEALPKTNPLVQTMSHGMESGVETSLMKRTGASWDVRGEAESIRNLQQVTLPGFLINERLNHAAVERSLNRELRADRPYAV